MEIKRLLLDLCMQKYKEYKKSSAQIPLKKAFPRSIIISHMKPDKKNLDGLREARATGITLETWRYDGRTLQQISVGEEPDFDVLGGEYFSEVYAQFAYFEELKQAYISIYIAPRWAAGYCYKVEYQDGKYEIQDEKVIWVS